MVEVLNPLFKCFEITNLHHSFFYSILKTNVKINCIHLTNSLISYIYIYQSILINYLVYYNICIFTCLLTCLFIVTSLNYYYSGLPNNLYRHIRSFIPFPILQFQFVKLFSINRRLNKHELYDHEQVNNCTIGFSSVIISNPRSFRAQRQREREENGRSWSHVIRHVIDTIFREVGARTATA